ncbi:sugar ABC transporter permease [Phyllobacterium sp. 21LDTY02-6]|uniref:multiple monosaccharide ABC transporter permease n=1 Tax=unclassified Phyllobacterium TaxID=2638441 RepID=UPI002021F4DF|nr:MULTISPECIES: multiple monosaccharide ABC transporter permease [unclassified Phyllobacterium]MCO4318325.1 sugar ABC transporter permease [Phyllobacterium sp. 21LDTY02-6]MCX8280320.1 sugar ABC transporter permease [Phyllobacterium sp. 0TCS1.6C]MCX8294119.1 sugar ABC transporter permease [Phyllobacterium sp. 0TCS1.6A]
MTIETASNSAKTEVQTDGSPSRSNLREYGLVLALILIMLFFQVATNGTLFRPVNLTNLILQNSYIIIMALGMLLVIVAGHIDLSVGSVSGFIGGLAAIMMVRWQIHFIPATIACLAMGGLIGAAQGYWVAYHKIPSFIVTLAGMLVFRGLALWLLGGQSVGPFPPQFQLLSSGFIPDVFAGTGFNITSMLIGVVLVGLMIYFSVRGRAKREKHGYKGEPFILFLGKNLIIGGIILYLVFLLSTYRGLPNVLVVMSLLIALFVFVTKRMTIGRRIYAMGGNEKAAKLSGIKTERLTFFTFVNMGVLAALAGLIFAARLNTATPKAGLGFELDVIAAVFIGGASALGGVGQVMGAVIGAFIMGVMNNGMSILGVNIDWQQVIKGLVLLAAVVFDVYNKNKT